MQRQRVSLRLQAKDQRMRAAARCKAHSQGDRCRKAAGHEAADDLMHEGVNASWQASKFREEKFPVQPTHTHFLSALKKLRAS